MDAKQAIHAAKVYVTDLFEDEGARNVRLEEIDFEPHRETWSVTVSFARVSDSQSAFDLALAPSTKRSYKVVTISDRDNKVVSLKNREGME